MTLIKSISGIRGTIGGNIDENLTPIDVVKYAAAYGSWLKQQSNKKNISVVVGRDARISGEMIQALVVNTLIGLGIDVLDLGLSTTPTVAIAVPLEKANGGIILTASHNPKQWNALKLLNHKGEFIDKQEGAQVLTIAKQGDFQFAEVQDLGNLTAKSNYLDIHINSVLNLPLVKTAQIKAANFKIVVDGINSTGGIAVPKLLEKLGAETIELNCEANGAFAHNPEPLEEHLSDICDLVVKTKADLGIVVDPDVDRLAFIDETGKMFGEEYTLVACADYVLRKTKGNTVSNLSSSRALEDITKKHGGCYEASAVGEVNVVALMKKTKAIIGGEGNGGVIFPALHYGRDAIVGIALFLSYLSENKIKASALRASYPSYFMSKKKIQLSPKLDVDHILKKICQNYKTHHPITTDGLKVNFSDSWVHLRKSNTEPIVRVYSEALSQSKANALAERFVNEVLSVSNQVS